MTRPLPRLAAALTVAALTLTGCHDGDNPFAPVPTADPVAIPTITAPTVAPLEPATPPDPDRPLAADVLATLEVKGRAPKTGYDRAQFGSTWADVDGNQCDQRNDTLKRDLRDETFEPDGCTVLTGTLDDPYTATRIQFQRGRETSGAVQIDHVVSLGNAWATGAQQLTAEERKMIGNDPINLQATDGPTNARKADGDAATWLPPARGYRCSYISRQIAVKAKFKLWVTAPERDAMATVLSTCPEQQLPAEAS